MAFAQKRQLGILFALGFICHGVVGCSPADEGSGSTQTPSSGGTSTKASSESSDPSKATGGSSNSRATSKSGDKSGNGGAKSSSKQQAAGGDAGEEGGDGSGGSEDSSKGGTSARSSAKSSAGGSSQASSSSSRVSESGGTSNASAAGGSGSGGKSGSSSATSAGGTSTGGKTGSGGASDTSSGDCQKGQVKASEVIIMGESFYAMSPQYIQKRIEENARKAGALGSGDSYRNVAISGQPMSVVAGEYDTALKGGPVKVVIMDGGGIDCMSSACDTCPDQFKTLLTKMASNGVKEVIYTRYPEPGNPPGSNATLKKNLDILMPKMQPVCESATGLRCHWVDLRPVWQNGDTSDGLHPTQSGGNHVGDAIWAEMVKQCIAQ